MNRERRPTRGRVGSSPRGVPPAREASGRRRPQEPPQRPPARPTVEIEVDSPITLGQLLKLAGSAGSGGQAKALLAAGVVTVNGEAETRRGRKLAAGDMVGLADRVLLLASAAPLDARAAAGETSVRADD